MKNYFCCLGNSFRCKEEFTFYYQIYCRFRFLKFVVWKNIIKICLDCNMKASALIGLSHPYLSLFPLNEWSVEKKNEDNEISYISPVVLWELRHSRVTPYLLPNFFLSSFWSTELQFRPVKDCIISRRIQFSALCNRYLFLT